MPNPVDAGPTALPAAPTRLPVGLKLFYGLGSVAFGIKDNGFQTILLLFYNQVVGMPAALVGLAIMIALAVDAIMDPIIGEWSDNLRTPWGRRHPLMYAAAIPLGLSYLLLWNPPYLSQQGLFLYLVVVSIVVRTFISLYEAPSQALGPELTSDYAERTALSGYRMAFQWFGGLIMYALAFQVFLRPDANHPIGQLNPAGYSHYGLAAGVLMVLTILGSALGTHGRIKTFIQPPERKRGLGEVLREVRASVANRSYLMILGSNLFSSTATGLAFSMGTYFYTYVWQLTSQQIAIFALVSILSAFLGSVLARLLAGRNKRDMVVVLFISGFVLSSGPLLLRLFGLFLPNGHPWLFPTLLLTSVGSLSQMIAAAVIAVSMIADVVEDSQVRTGRRSEGLFFAGQTFVQKAVSGVGIFLTSLILAAVHFPTAVGGKSPAVSPEVTHNLVLVYLPTVAVLYGLCLVWLAGYRITRESHAATLKQLAETTGEGVHVIPEV
jgi:glycoside/pentoside/hexuronide:cation symporter, GPH family